MKRNYVNEMRAAGTPQERVRVLTQAAFDVDFPAEGFAELIEAHLAILQGLREEAGVHG